MKRSIATSALALSTYAPINGFQTRAAETDRMANLTRNQVARKMIMMAEAIGHASLAGFWADCVMCGGRKDLDAIVLGHIDPASGYVTKGVDYVGGKCHPANVLPMCGPCNGRLSDVDPTTIVTLKYDSRYLWDGILPTDQSNCKIKADADADWDYL